CYVGWRLVTRNRCDHGHRGCQHSVRTLVPSLNQMVWRGQRFERSRVRRGQGCGGQGLNEGWKVADVRDEAAGSCGFDGLAAERTPEGGHCEDAGCGPGCDIVG